MSKSLAGEVEKYESRLILMKKIHEDQLSELKKTISEREAELEDKIYQFNKHKDTVYEKVR